MRAVALGLHLGVQSFTLKDLSASAANCLKRLYQPGLAAGLILGMRVEGRYPPLILLIMVVKNWWSSRLLGRDAEATCKKRSMRSRVNCRVGRNPV